MHKLYELKENLIDELEAYSGKGNLSKDDVMSVKYLSSSIDHICNIIDACESDSDYSGRGMSYNGNSYAVDGRRGGYSRARRRDSMGRYSRAGEDFRSELQELIQDAPNEHIRQKMQMIMSEM